MRNHPSTENVIAVQSQMGTARHRVQLGPFAANPSIAGKPACRRMGPVDVVPGSTIQEYIREALQGEIFLAGAYDPRGPRPCDGNAAKGRA